MKRSLKDQQGFTLIELMVVVLIIGILVAIALPTFLGARTRAQDSAAKAQLRTAYAGAKAYFADGNTYDNFNVFPNPENEETGTRWVHANVTPTRGTVTINLSEGNLLVLGTASESGRFFCLYANEGAIVAPDLPVVRGNQDTTGAAAGDTKCLPPSTW